MSQFNHSFHPRKRFSQNFLTDHRILQKIIRSIAPHENDHIVEIGPGHGALTQYLFPLVDQLDLIEIDRDLVRQLQHQFSSNHRVTIHQADALHFNLHDITNEKKSLRIVGNLPYHISTPLLFHLFEFSELIKDMYFMLQKEVVLRLTAEVGSHNYGRLSVMSQFYCNNQLLFSVSPQAFSPRPKVESAFLAMYPRDKPIIEPINMTTFANVVREAFNYRRKTLSNALKRFINAENLNSLHIDPHLRPQEISPEGFVKISNAIEKQNHGEF